MAAVKEAYASGDSERDVLRDIRENFEIAYDAERENFEAALDDLQFVAGEQWPANVKADRVDDGLPCLTINRMPQFVRQVTNDIRLNTFAVKVSPVDSVADPETADIYAGLIRHIERQSQAKDIYVGGAESAARCGYGNWRVITQYADDSAFEQEILIAPISNFSAVLWDPLAKDYTRKDARYCFVTDRVSKAEFRGTWPDAREVDFNGNTQDGYLSDWFSDDSVRIAEYFKKVKKDRVLALLQDGQTVDVTDIDGFKRQFLPIVRTRKAKVDAIEWCKVSGAEVLEGPTLLPGRYIPIVPVWGEEINIGDRTVRHGVIRFAKDAQRLYNYWRTTLAEQIALQPKAPFVGMDEQIGPYKSIWEAANTGRKAYLPYAKVKGTDRQPPPPQRQLPPQGSPAIAAEIALASEDMKATTGIYDAALGQKSNETSGRAIENRQRESDISTFSYPDNVRRAVEHTGRILVDLIPKIYDTERIVRIRGEDDSDEFVPINQLVMAPEGPMFLNDLSVGRFDVSVSAGPSFSTRRMEAASMLEEFIRAIPDQGKFLTDLWIEQQDWPGAEAMVARLRKLLPPEMRPKDEKEEPPTPEEMQAAEAQQALAQLEMREKEAETAKKEAEAKLKNSQAIGEDVETMGKMRELDIRENELNFKRESLAREDRLRVEDRERAEMDRRFTDKSEGFMQVDEVEEMVGEGLSQLANSMAQLAQMLAEGQRQNSEAIQRLAAAQAAPVRIERDAKGKIVGASKEVTANV